MPKFVKISADEAQSKRKEFIHKSKSGQEILVKARAGKDSPPSWDKESRTARFVMTAQVPDRYGDIVVTEGIKIDTFVENPVALAFHNSRDWSIGSWKNLEKVLKGRPPRMEGDLAFLPAGGPVKLVDEAAWMVEHGGIKACSIGFMPNWAAVESIIDDEGHWMGLRFFESELLECSVTPIPANPDALVKDAGADLPMAKELLEQFLDEYARDPITKQLLSRKEFEDKYKIITGDQKSVIIEGKAVDLTANAPEPENKDTAKADEPTAEQIKSFDQFVGGLKKGVDVWVVMKAGDVVTEKDGVKSRNEIHNGFATKDSKYEGPVTEEMRTTIAAKLLQLKVEKAEDEVDEHIYDAVAKAVPAFDGGTVAVEGAVKRLLVSKDGKWSDGGALKDDATADHLVIATKKDDGSLEYKAAPENTRKKKVDSLQVELAFEFDEKAHAEREKTLMESISKFFSDTFGALAPKVKSKDVETKPDDEKKDVQTTTEEAKTLTAEEESEVRARALALKTKVNLSR